MSADFVSPVGEGPGEITPDGCAVDLYLLLEPRGEAERPTAGCGRSAAR